MGSPNFEPAYLDFAKTFVLIRKVREWLRRSRQCFDQLGKTMKHNAGPERTQTQFLGGEEGGISMSPPQFKLEAGSDLPIQRKKVTLSDGNTIETKKRSKNELESLQVQMMFAGRQDIASEIAQAVRNGEFLADEDLNNDYIEFQDYMKNNTDYSDTSDNEDDDYQELESISGHKHLMLPGINFALDKSKEREGKQPMPLNTIKGNMYELSFDKMRQMDGFSNISSNSHLMNCPGIDHISPFGGKMFEQSKNYTTGDLDEITDTYLNTFDESAKMGSLLFNKGSGSKETGKKIRNMFDMIETEEGFDTEQKTFGSDMVKKMEGFSKDDETNPFDEEEENVQKFQSMFYMQTPSDVFENLLSRKLEGKKHKENSIPLNSFFPNDLSTTDMKEFEEYCVSNKLALRPKELKENKKKNDDMDFIEEEEFN
jgi:hypothetical protein